MPTPASRTELLRELRARTSAQPPPGSVRVQVGGHSCGWAAPAVADALSAAPGARPGAGSIGLPADDARLAEAALLLRDAGLLNGWRGELLDVVADHHVVLARVERAVMRPLGLATRAVHLNAYTESGEMWIARRADHKTTDPGMWDTLVGGLIAAGENPDVALLRESDEEAGLSLEDLAARRPAGGFLVTRRVPEGYQVEQVTVTDCVLPATCRPANRDGEVSAIRTASLEEVMEMIAAGLFTTEAALSILTSLETRSP